MGRPPAGKERGQGGSPRKGILHQDIPLGKVFGTEIFHWKRCLIPNFPLEKAFGTKVFRWKIV
jgi:hypothetical protein